MVFLATIDPSPRLQPIKFPVFSQLAGNLASETGSLETASSSGESGTNRAAAGDLRAPMNDTLHHQQFVQRATGSCLRWQASHTA